MAYLIDQYHQDNLTANFPTTSGSTVNYGFNVNAGALEALEMRSDITFGATPTAGSYFALFDAFRVVINSEVVFSYTSAGGSMGNALTTADAFSYFVNSLGGVARENPSGSETREAYLKLPIGRMLTDGANRVEISITYGATGAGATPASGKVSFFGIYNDAMSQKVLVAPATSYQHTSNAVEQVVVKVAGYDIQGYTVAGVLVQNDSAADEIGQNGIRVIGLGSYGLEPDHWREINGDLANGVQYNAAAETASQTFAFGVDGALFVPTLGLAGGDIQMVIDSSATTTRFYTPVLVATSQGKIKEARQTETVRQSPTKKILSRLE